ncbi:MAG: hypothetical protein ACMUIL_08865 [bacterium]
MKDILQLVTTRIIIFPNDYIPYSHLMRPDFINHIVKKYKFKKQEMPTDLYSPSAPQLIVFHGGEFNFEDKMIIVHTLQFEDRKIILECEATTQVLEQVRDKIKEDIIKFDPKQSFNFDDAVYQTDETFCVVILDVDFMDVYSKKFIDFINKNFAPRLKHDFLEIIPKNMRFTVEFKPDLNLLQNESITLSPKELVIEPRTKTGIKKKTFQTKSSFDSDTHLKMLEEFEKTFKEKKK